jgi:hypothetical protein
LLWLGLEDVGGAVVGRDSFDEDDVAGGVLGA